MNGLQDLGHLQLTVIQGVPLQAYMTGAPLSDEGILAHIKEIIAFLPSQRAVIIIVVIRIHALCRMPFQAALLA